MTSDIERRAKEYAEKKWGAFLCRGVAEHSYLAGARAEVAIERERILDDLAAWFPDRILDQLLAEDWREIKKIIEGA